MPFSYLPDGVCHLLLISTEIFIPLVFHFSQIFSVFVLLKIQNESGDHLRFELFSHVTKNVLQDA